MDWVKILKDSEFIEESVRIILFSIVSILLGIKDEGFGKKYQKKYILITYLVIALYAILIGFGDMKNKINLFFLLFFINLLGGINISYESDNMMKELGRFRLFIFKFFEWFYITKSYIFYICFFSL
ncbi:hypothetical protein FYJ27_10720 [Anaerosalibacter bizertensis]|uniref:Uncharacterized protein n=1 Tax=Anaerosalibacter bizertensis TaxID=932217 RepID=A0A844FJV7_9FIRM|nr:hypothetical protein [Anaerosalibacter bizertensis]MSS44178.1 hypothetical protein [Anaerosalibacter bizertensis]